MEPINSVEVINEIWHSILFPILTTAITAIFGYIGVQLKKLFEKHVADKTKREEAKKCVLAVEQIYKNLHGPEKYAECVTALSTILNEKGIMVSDFEIKILIESALAELNKVFEENTDEQLEPQIGFALSESAENPTEIPAEDVAEICT